MEQDKTQSKKRWFPIILVVVSCLALLIIQFWPKPRHKTVHNFDQCVGADYPLSETDPQFCTDLEGHKFINKPQEPTPQPTHVGLAFDTLVSSIDGPVKPERTVVSTQAEWQAFWQRTHAHLAFKSPLIPVDFSKKTVIAVVDGRKPVGNYMKITEVALVTDIILVTIDESTLPSACAVPKGTISPYQIVQIDKTQLPVRFNINKHTLNASCKH